MITYVNLIDVLSVQVILTGEQIYFYWEFQDQLEDKTNGSYKTMLLWKLAHLQVILTGEQLYVYWEFQDQLKDKVNESYETMLLWKPVHQLHSNKNGSLSRPSNPTRKL